MLYTIVFEDKSVFAGGNLEETKWQEIPDKKISSIFYSLPFGGVLLLSKYEKYYHFVEATKDINVKNSKVKLEYTYIIGKKDRQYLINKISLINGSIERSLVDEKDKLISQLNPIGWKNGI